MKEISLEVKTDLIMKKFLPILIIAFLFSCKEYAKDEEMMISSTEVVEATADMRYSEMAAPMSPDQDANLNDSSPVEEPIEQKVIKKATLKFETSDLEKTRNQIQKAIVENKASIQQENEGKEGYSFYKRITIRVPNQNFEKLIASIGNGVSYFDEKEISSQDVTAEFIDTEARLKTKKTLETRYLELLKKAGKVSEMLEIEKKLSEIREEIESKEGQLQYMQRQVSMSSVYVEFYKTSPSESGVTKSFGSKMVNALETGFLGLSSLFLWFLEVWPFIIILVALFFLVRRRFKRKKA
jgi:hypothetical protein